MKNSLDTVKFGEKIKELRMSRNLTQDELADELHVSRKTISKWEAGMGLPSIEILIFLSKSFDVSMEELLGDEKGKAKGKNDTPVFPPYRLTRIFVTSILLVVMFFLLIFFASTFNKIRIYSIYSTNAQVVGNFIVAKYRRIFNINEVRVSDKAIIDKKYYDADYQIMMNDEVIQKMGNISDFTGNQDSELFSLSDFINDISVYIIDDLPNFANPIKNNYSIKVNYIDENFEKRSYVIKFKMNEFFANNQIFYENYEM